MAACAYCHTPNADLYDLGGNVVCQGCNARMQAQQQDARAQAQTALDPIGASLTFASPKTLFRAGIGMIAGSIALGALELFVGGRVHVVLIGILFVSGAAALYRSWT